uniref:Deoxyuridine 5'-triphosphate nucleotidohydrolase n=1 Tax=Jaculus jaculus TaxID=51337 RepID=A0A8C5LBC5_JACJA
MPCSEEVVAVSPSKRVRATEEGASRLRFVRLSELATAPTRGSARAKTIVKTNIQMAVPPGLAPRSGLAVKHFIDVGAGVIDEDYRGNVGGVLFNFGKEKSEVKQGDRIAQLIFQVLDDTERGSGGFGSTGKN